MTDTRNRFIQAQTSTARALSGDRRFTVVFDTSPAGRIGQDTAVPLPADPADGDLNAIRGLADLEALKRRHHEPRAHARHAPTAAAARALYDWAEEARVSALAQDTMLGVVRNLDAALERRCRDAVPDTAAADVDTPLAMAAGLWLREQLTGRDLPATAARIVGSRRQRIAGALAPFLPALKAGLHNPAAFAAEAVRLPGSLNMPTDDGSTTTGEPINGSDDDGDAEDDTQPAHAVPAPPDDAAANDRNEALHRSRAVEASPIGAPRQADQDDDQDSSHTDSIGVREAPTGASGRYHVYNRSFDQTTRATEALDVASLERLYAQLRQRDGNERAAITRLARRLERALMAEQRRRWAFEQEDGALDAARLTSVVVDPTSSLPFKREVAAPFPDTVLTLLLDCSGSMRGRPIRLAGLCTVAVGEALARCAVKVEVLGFTTGAWQGGESGAAWERAGRPAGPGRLNDLHHIIFKDADTPWRRARRNLGLLLQDDLLKENIDGEALQWAHQRLLRRREERRILLVVSDGLPRDGMTQSANPPGFLEAHLRHVIDHIETRSSVELAAIGIGHDITAHYRNAVAIPTADRLAPAMTRQLLALFTGRGESEQEQ